MRRPRASHDAVLEKLAALNIGSETVAALALVPLIAIAWSDGSIDDEERATVFAKAQEEGISPGDISRELFERWLSERPPANLLAVWKNYVLALVETMSADDRRFFKGRVLDRAHGMAEAAGGSWASAVRCRLPSRRCWTCWRAPFRTIADRGAEKSHRSDVSVSGVTTGWAAGTMSATAAVRRDGFTCAW